MAYSKLYAVTELNQQIQKKELLSCHETTTLTSQLYRQDRQIKLICGFCDKPFKNPTVLPCFHTYCQSCLIRKNNDKIICYACRYDFGERSKIDIFPNIVITICLEGLENDSSTLCCHCMSVKPIVSVCLDCKGYMCSPCSKNASYCQADGALAIRVNPSLRNRCPFHSEERLFLFCFLCGKPTCRICMNDKHSEENHAYEYLDVVEKEIYKELKDKINENKIMLLNAMEFLSHVPEKRRKITEFYRTVQNQLLARLGMDCAIHEKSRKKWLLIIDTTYSQNMARMSNLTTHLSDTITKLKNVHLFFEGFCKFTEISNRLMIKASIERFFIFFKPQDIMESIKSLENDYVSYTNFIVEEVKKEYNCLVTCGVRSQKRDFSDFVVGEIVEGVRNLHLKEGTKLAEARRPEVPQVKCENPVDKEMLVIGTKLMGNLLLLKRVTIRYLARFGSPGTAHGQFSELNGIAVTENRTIIVPDSNNHRIEVFDTRGTFLYTLNEDHTRTSLPNLVAISKRSKNVVICERTPCREIKVYTQSGVCLRTFGANVLTHPRAITTDNDGKIIVVESRVKKVVIFNEEGMIFNKFNCYEVDFPISASVNGKGEIFIADNKQHNIKVYNYRGQLLREIGCKGITNYPIAVKVTDTGEVVVADNHDNLKLTLFYDDGRLITGYMSKIKQNQCLDFDFIGRDYLAITCLDRQVYIYEYPQWRDRVSSNDD